MRKATSVSASSGGGGTNMRWSRIAKPSPSRRYETMVERLSCTSIRTGTSRRARNSLLRDSHGGWAREGLGDQSQSGRRGQRKAQLGPIPEPQKRSYVHAGILAPRGGSVG